MIFQFIDVLFQDVSPGKTFSSGQRSICSFKEQLFDDLLVVVIEVRVLAKLIDCQMQGWLSNNVLDIYFGTQMQQQFHIAELFSQDGKMEWCRLELILAIDIELILLCKDE